MKRVVAAGVALVMPMLASAGDLELTMNRAVLAHHTYVTVGEVAVIGDGKDAEDIRELRINLHAKPGSWVRISRQRIRDVIAASGRRVKIGWQGPAFAEVKLSSKTVANRVLVEAALECLAELAQRDGKRVTMKAVGQPGDIEVPAGELRVSARRTSTAWRPRTRVEIDLWVDGSRVSSVPVWIDLRMPGSAVVAGRDLSAGSILSPGDVRVSEADLLMVKGRPVRGPEQLNRMRVKRGVSEGEVISELDVEPRPPIMRGEPVRGELSVAAVALEVEGVAVEDGGLGERIKVQRASDSSAWFYGVVTGEGTVAVYE